MLAKEEFRDPNAVKFVQMKVQDRMNALNTRSVDFVISLFSVTEDRKKYFYFSTPYFISPYRMLVTDKSAIKTRKDLDGKKVGFVFGSIDEEFLKKNISENVNYVGFNSTNSAFRALESGQIDAPP